METSEVIYKLRIFLTTLINASVFLYFDEYLSTILIKSTNYKPQYFKKTLLNLLIVIYVSIMWTNAILTNFNSRLSAFQHIQYHFAPKNVRIKLKERNDVYTVPFENWNILFHVRRNYAIHFEYKKLNKEGIFEKVWVHENSF